MKIRTQFSASFHEVNISPKDMIEKLIALGYLDSRENSKIGKWFLEEVMPWMRLIRADNQAVAGVGPLPPIWEQVYPEIYVSVDGETFIVHAKCEEGSKAAYNRSAFNYPVQNNWIDFNGDEHFDKVSPMNYRLVDKVYTDEPVFVVKGRDPQAPVLMNSWAVQRAAAAAKDNDAARSTHNTQKAVDVIEMVEGFRQWKISNAFTGVPITYGYPAEMSAYWSLGQAVGEAVLSNLKVSVTNVVEPETGKCPFPVIDIRRARNADGEYSKKPLTFFGLARSNDILGDVSLMTTIVAGKTMGSIPYRSKKLLVTEIANATAPKTTKAS